MIETKVEDLLSSIEYVNNFKFIKRGETIYHAYDMFMDSINKNKRNLDAIFITENGSAREKILGMITIDDFAGKINSNLR